MSTVLAYVIVVVLSSFVLTLGAIVGGFAFALTLAWAPMRFRVVVASTLAGILAVFAVVWFGYFVFRWIVGPDSYGGLPYWASIIPLSIPIVNDRIRAKKEAEATAGIATDVDAVTRKLIRDESGGLALQVRGYWIGLFAATILFSRFHLPS